jgi:hypothetical protein
MYTELKPNTPELMAKVKEVGRQNPSWAFAKIWNHIQDGEFYSSAALVCQDQERQNLRSVRLLGRSPSLVDLWQASQALIIICQTLSA